MENPYPFTSTFPDPGLPSQGEACRGIPFRSHKARLEELQETLDRLLGQADMPGHETLIDPDDIRAALEASRDRIIHVTKEN